MKIGGMGEQAIRVQFWELRRIHELPEEVQILAVLPELPERVELAYVEGGNPRRPVPIRVYSQPLHSDWVPHRRPSTINVRCLYVHVQHRYCYRGTEQGAPLIIEDLDDFIKRFREIAEDEAAKRGQRVSENTQSMWVNDDA